METIQVSRLKQYTNDVVERVASDQGTTGFSVTVRGLLVLEDRYGYGLPFDGRAARMYRVLCGAVREAGRVVGRTGRTDLMIAAVAAADGAALLPHNTHDVIGVEGIVPILDAGGTPATSARGTNSTPTKR